MVLVGISSVIGLHKENLCIQKDFTEDYVFLIPIMIVVMVRLTMNR